MTHTLVLLETPGKHCCIGLTLGLAKYHRSGTVTDSHRTSSINF